ncbi:MAG: hypothetical protein R6V47_01705 [Candidatus Delongbacteria bacterium]
MIDFFYDRRSRAILVFGLYLLFFIAGLIMSYSGLKKFTVSAIKKPNGRVEVFVKDRSLFFIKSNSRKIAPVTNIRFFTETAEDKSLNTFVILYTLKGEHRLYGSKAELHDKEKRNLYNELQFFIDDADRSEFFRSFSFNRIYGYIGLIIMILSGYLTVISYKNIPAQEHKKNINLRSVLHKLTGKLLSLTKSSKKSFRPHPRAETRTDDLFDENLKILIIAFDSAKMSDPEIFNFAADKNITIACNKNNRNKIINKFGSSYRYISFDENENELQALLVYIEHLGDFAGYLIISSEPDNDIRNKKIAELYKFHKENNSECTLATTIKNASERKKGFIIRNIANRIVKIGDPERSTEEAFAGIYCFNTTKLFSTVTKYRANNAGLDLSAIIEEYGKKNYRMSSFLVTEKTKEKSFAHPSVKDEQKTEKRVKTAGVIVTSQHTQPQHVDRQYKALSLPQIERTFIIVRSEQIDDIKFLLQGAFELIVTNDDLGDGYDVLKAYDELKEHKGDTIVIPDIDTVITQKIVEKLIDLHSSGSDICTYLTKNDLPVLYCVRTSYFTYAVKRIIKDDETKKYYLSQIIEILINDKKKVTRISLEDWNS